MFLTIFLSMSIVCLSERSQYNPCGMDYQLRRPITYLYNRLAYKFDVNPYTAHLLQTQSVCSSRTGPFCGFFNGRRLMQNKILVNDNAKALYQALVESAPSSKEVAFLIQRGQLDAFLISSQSHKIYDGIIKEIIQKDFYGQTPSSQKATQISQLKQQLSRQQYQKKQKKQTYIPVSTK